jgi:hypothetical protein
MSERITAVLDQIEAEAEAAAPDGRTALELLQAIYRDKRNPVHLRMRGPASLFHLNSQSSQSPPISTQVISAIF